MKNLHYIAYTLYPNGQSITITVKSHQKFNEPYKLPRFETLEEARQVYEAELAEFRAKYEEMEGYYSESERHEVRVCLDEIITEIDEDGEEEIIDFKTIEQSESRYYEE